MGRFIVKLTDKTTKTDYYFEWSTVVDAPVSWGVPLSEFKQYYKEKYGTQGMKELDSELELVEALGVSSRFHDINSILEYNRAGKKEKTLNREGLLNNYCRNRIGREEEAIK